MPSTEPNSLFLNWILHPRRIHWELILGIRKRKPNVFGSFTTTLRYIDDQGEKWGDTYVKFVGQHFDDYAHWDFVHQYMPITGTEYTPTFIPAPFAFRRFKGAAPGVTGLIGEVLTTIFIQNELNLSPFDLAHLMEDRKAPDLCLDIHPTIISDLLRRNDLSVPRIWNINLQYANIIEQAVWPEPLPVECKSRRGTDDRQLRAALIQLLEYWRRVPVMAGYGIIAQADIIPKTRLRLHLLIPQPNQLEAVRKIITGQILGTELQDLPEKPTIKQFKDIVGGMLLE